MAHTATEPRTDITPDPDLDRVTEPDPSLTIVQALNRVMKDVTVVRKEREQASSGGRFMFRGIDDVMNAVGPAFRRHGVICLPNVLDVAVEHATTSKGSAMTVTRVQVEYTFYGPAGDSVACRAPGEAFDSGDKSTAKAMSVAYRTALLQALTLPTDEPDPDETVEELAPRQQRTALTPDEQHALSALMREDDADALRAAWRQAEATQTECPDLVVKPGVDITREQANILGVPGPLRLLDVIGRIGKHLTEEGISVKDHIAAEAAPVAAANHSEGAGQ